MCVLCVYHCLHLSTCSSQSTTDVTEEEMEVPGERKEIERERERGREAAREGERERIVVYAKHEHCCI